VSYLKNTEKKFTFARHSFVDFIIRLLFLLNLNMSVSPIPEAKRSNCKTKNCKTSS
jgi:hypothetical protein